jgi:hypothetical protein
MYDLDQRLHLFPGPPELCLPPKWNFALDQYRDGSKLLSSKDKQDPVRGGMAFGRHAN